MHNSNHTKFYSNVLLTLWWCIGNDIKLIRSGVKALVVFKLRFLFCASRFVLAAPDPFINHLKHFIMQKQNAQSGIVYDSFNDVTWDFSGFFELLADYYDGNLTEMTEQLIAVIETLMHMQDDSILEPMVKNSTLNLLTVRELLQGIEKPNTN